MQYDISTLTFDTNVQVQENDLVAHVPSNLMTEAALFSELHAQLHFPPPYSGPSWNYLHDWLRASYDWADWNQCTRVVLIHKDIPLLHSRWYEARTYLGIVIDSILRLRTTPLPTENSSQKHPRAVIAIFPATLYEQIQTLLTRPAPWYASIGMQQGPGPAYLQLEIDPIWDIIPPWLERLDGLTAEYFNLSRDNRVSLTVTYLRHYAGYCVEYSTIAEPPDKEEQLLLSSPIEHNIPTRLLSLSEVIPIVRYFYEHEDVPADSQWYAPSMSENALEELFLRWYYHNEEMEFVERPYEMVHTMMYEAMQTAVAQEQKLLSIKDWQRIVVHHQEKTHDQYLAALCFVGREDTLATTEQFLALLESNDWQERWISAHFLGLQHSDRALPVLMKMLIENLLLLFDLPGGDWCYYWREHTPKLLRTWQIPSVLNALFQALQSWIAAEAFFRENYDNDFYWWMSFEASLCYELGYRDAFELVLQLPLQAAHHQFLLVSMAQGYYTKSHSIGFRDETQQELRRHTHIRSIENDIVGILETRCGFSSEQGHELLAAYHEASSEYEISF